MSNNTTATDKAPKPMGLYPHARKVGNLIFVSGMGPRVPGTDEVPGSKFDKNGNCLEHDFAKQVHSVLNNIKVVLEEAGSGFDKIVDVTTFLTNMKRDFKTYNKIYADYFKDIQPTRTTVEVKSLPSPIDIELKVIAEI